MSPTRPHDPKKPAPRVVSLLPSATEILCYIGGKHLLVARSHECDRPEGLEAPALTASRIAGLPEAAIDRAVSQSVSAGGSLYTLNEAELAAARPDVILTQDLCDLCSIDLRTVERIVGAMEPRPMVVNLNPTTIEGMLDDVLRVGRAVGLAPQAEAAMVGLRERLNRAEEFVNPYADGVSVAFLEWTDPLFVAGHWTVQMIERAGGTHRLNPSRAKENAGAAMGLQAGERVAGRSIRVTPEQLVQAEPEYLIICPCGLDLAAARRGASALAREAWWRELPAVRRHTAREPRVAVVDGNQMFNRPGPRLVDAFEWLVAWINGREERVPAGFPWERWSG